MVRSSHRRCSVRKGVLRNFAKLSGKHLCQSLFFNKVAVLRAVTITKKQTLRQMFSCEFCVISKSKFFTEHLWATASVWSKLSLFKWWYCWQLTLSLKYYCRPTMGTDIFIFSDSSLWKMYFASHVMMFSHDENLL